MKLLKYLKRSENVIIVVELSHHDRQGLYTVLGIDLCNEQRQPPKLSQVLSDLRAFMGLYSIRVHLPLESCTALLTEPIESWERIEKLCSARGFSEARCIEFLVNLLSDFLGLLIKHQEL
ncbi:MAG: hypothetical protein N3E36_04460 [Sulfolobales archaeon]|nr:hypothetical protein [Sulfolobales archaeon]MCX8199267.1 hypothetical protein [Sulfolobales archaeon]MDW8170419.1 hypothetical protein [Desulfurococcaceae archaeon]